MGSITATNFTTNGNEKNVYEVTKHVGGALQIEINSARLVVKRMSKRKLSEGGDSGEESDLLTIRPL